VTRCEQYEVSVALYAGGDLPDSEIAALQSHLAECPDCRLLMDELCETREEVASLAAVELPFGMETAVRSRVLAAVAERRRRAWRWWLAPVAVSVLVLAMIPAVRFSNSKAVPVALNYRPATPAAPVLAPATKTAPLVAKVRRERATSRPAPERQDEFMRIMTDDPDIVIFWSISDGGPK